ncbi:hypothetical protein K432DRAFT_325441 [Lepidopterella palustris CBS 459.81]|uniref:Protein CMS1 n=1 Tax=Lepidopterella palustris CBS 459.81 TaxID=1314670 RepID=A0A8E2EDK0_9PEZI|nr:hypothetical protein K432DRAFT_325441 [Lepidopterella palustris CBS 459.81]
MKTQNTKMSDSEHDGFMPLIESDFDSPPASASKKRKRETDIESKKEKKSAKRRKNKKPKNIQDEDLNEELGINVAFARMDSQLLADYINQRTAHYETDLSTVELDDRYIPARAIQDSSSFDKPRTTDHLATFLRQCCGKLRPVPQGINGSPHTLVITAAGLRAADITRALKTGLPKEGISKPQVAKLFAKHIKLKEAIDSCTKSSMDFGVGTPHRISELLENGALKCTNLKRVIIDVSHIDGKKRGILDMKELHKPLIDLLIRRDFKGDDGTWNDKFQLCFF